MSCQSLLVPDNPLPIKFIKNLLENRHNTHVRWYQKVDGISADGDKINAHVTLQATVHDCVNMHRLEAKQLGFTFLTDAEHLQNFIAQNWGKVIIDD